MVIIKDFRMPNSCDMCDFAEFQGNKIFCSFPECGFEVTNCIATRDKECRLREKRETINIEKVGIFDNRKEK